MSDIHQNEYTGRAVVVSTDKRGIFFGYIKGGYMPGDPNITLYNCRNCVHWSADVKGFMGLAVTGPTDGCRIGPAAPYFEIRGVTGVAGVTSEAIDAWEKAPWSR